MQDEVRMKLRIHADETVGAGKQHRGDHEPPAAWRASQIPRSGKRAIQQGLTYSPEYQLLGQPRHRG